MPRARHEHRLPGYHRRQQSLIIIEVIFQVRILDHHDVSGRGGQAFADGKSLAARTRLKNDFHTLTPCIGFHDLPAAVGRVALDDDHLLVTPVRRKASRDQQFPNRGAFVVHGHDDRHRTVRALDRRDSGHDGRSRRQWKLPAAHHLGKQPVRGHHAALPHAQFVALHQPVGKHIQRIGSPFGVEPDLFKAGREQHQMQGLPGEVPAIGGLPLVRVRPINRAWSPSSNGK